MHQTIIGQEALKQLEYAGDFPDIVIAPLVGAQTLQAYLFHSPAQFIVHGKNVRCIIVEPASCPKLTKVFSNTILVIRRVTPLLPMYTLGHNFKPASIRAGGLRYHGAKCYL